MAEPVEDFYFDTDYGEEEDISSSFQLWNFENSVRPGVHINYELRHKLAVVALMNPHGLDIQALNRYYTKIFGHSLNSVRDCGCSYTRLIDYLIGDVFEGRPENLRPSKRLQKLAEQTKPKDKVTLIPRIPPVPDNWRQRHLRPLTIKVNAVAAPKIDEVKISRLKMWSQGELKESEMRFIWNGLKAEYPGGILLEFIPAVFEKLTGHQISHKNNLVTLANDLADYSNWFYLISDTNTKSLFVNPIRPETHKLAVCVGGSADKNLAVQSPVCQSRIRTECIKQFEMLPSCMKKLAIRTVDGLYEGLLNKKVINFVIQMKEENRFELKMKFRGTESDQLEVDKSAVAQLELEISAFVLARKIFSGAIEPKYFQI